MVAQILYLAYLWLVCERMCNKLFADSASLCACTCMSMCLFLECYALFVYEQLSSFFVDYTRGTHTHTHTHVVIRDVYKQQQTMWNA